MLKVIEKVIQKVICIVPDVDWGLFGVWVWCLGFSFRKFRIDYCSAQWEQAVRWLQQQVVLKLPQWHFDRLV